MTTDQDRTGPVAPRTYASDDYFPESEPSAEMVAWADLQISKEKAAREARRLMQKAQAEKIAKDNGILGELYKNETTNSWCWKNPR